MPVYPSGGTIAQSVGSPGFGPAPAPSFNASGSVRFNPADTASISFTPTLQGSRTTWTWGGWVKRSGLSTLQNLFAVRSGNETTIFRLETTNTLLFYAQNSTPTTTANYTTASVLRDVSAWYHVLVAIDTTQPTAADRVKIYVNGVLQTLTTTTAVAQYAQLFVNVPGYLHTIGVQNTIGEYFSGYLADINFVDGLALTPSSFTATDANTGQLVPAQYTGNRGTNGFYLPFSSAALAADLGQNQKTTAQDYPYWPYSTLLVNTTSTNGAQNNTFLDSSTNNFTITRNGNTTQGNFTPFNYGGGTAQTNGYYSGYFDGAGDYLTYPGSAFTGNFTCEFWFFSNSGTATTVGAWISSVNASVIGYLPTEDRVLFSSSTDASANYTNQITSTATFPSRTWTHYAFTRSGSTTTLYVNGQSVGTGTYSGSLNFNFIARQASYTPRDFNGYISNFRVTNTVVYTSNFTPTTTPLTAISGTQVLTCQSSQFIDNSANAYTVSTFANSQPVPTNPFGMTAWSGYFDGAGDYLTTASSSNLALGSGDFTIEMWANPTNTSAAFRALIASDAYAGTTNGWTIYQNGASIEMYYAQTGGGSTPNIFTASSVLTANVWQHVAISRASGTLRCFVNGVQVASVSNSLNFAGNSIFIGDNNAGSYFFNGLLSNVRIVKGTALYTANFTPPTAPLTAISGTSLLTCQSSTFVDNSTNAFAINVFGNSYTGTLNNPFGNPINYTTPPVQAWSTYFDGSGDYISTTPTALTYGIGTNLFTWESWIYTTNSSATGQGIWHYYTTVVDNFYPYIVSSTGTFNCTLRATNQAVTTVSSPSGVIRLNQWHHVVVTRDSATNISLYVDGKKVANGTIAATTSFADTVMNTTNGNNPTIGAQTNVVREYFYGYISNLRFVKGAVVYTGNFTPPTAPLTAIPGTMTLACQSNRVRDNSILNAAQVANGNTSISPVSPFIPSQAWSAASYGGTMYFDGSDYLTAPHDASLSPTGNFTIEFWVYNTGPTSVQEWVTKGFGIQIYSFNSLWYAAFSSNNTTTYFINASFGASLLNTWQHIAVTRSGNTYTGFVNGVATSLGTSASAPGTGTSLFAAGVSTLGTPYYVTGYMSGLRVINGTALYTTPFVPPVLPPTAIANTSLLLNATNAGITDATGQNVLETVGNAQVSTAVKKWGTSSVYFDGSGDYLVIPTTNAPCQFGTADFTIEAWIYSTTIANQQMMLSNRIAATGSANFDWQIVSSRLLFGTTSTNLLTGTITLSSNTWYHVAVSRVSGTARMFVNGVLDTSTTTSFNLSNNSITHIGTNATYAPTQYPFIGYIQDFRVTKGVGRYSGNFTPPAAAFAYNQYDIGNQQWLPNNISVTAGINQDNLVDSPSDYGTDTGLGGQVRGNYATLNTLDNGGLALSNGNLDANRNSASWLAVRATIQGITSGKWYWECTTPTSISGTNYPMVGVAWNSQVLTNYVGSDFYGYGCSFFSGQKFNNGVNTNYGTAFATNDIMGVAFDADNGKIWFSKNGTWFASGDPVAGTNAAYTGITGQIYAPTFSVYGTNSTVVVNFGQRAFSYAAPTGFKCLVSTNLPTTNNIGATSSTQADNYFDLALYTGNGSTQSILLPGQGFTPDFTWIKSRSSATEWNVLCDSLRGPNKLIYSNSDLGEATVTNVLNSFDSGGFSVGYNASYTNARVNTNTATYVGWAWRGGGSTGATNNDGSITSTVSASATSGFSVVRYTGTGANATVGHGLGKQLKFIMVKELSNTDSWIVWHTAIPGTQYLALNTEAAAATAAGVWNSTVPSSSAPYVFSVGTNTAVNQSGQQYVAYCFTDISSFSSMGTYAGTGVADGPFIYTGFRPSYILFKNTTSGAAGSTWVIKDDLRAASYNPATGNLYANFALAEDTTATVNVDLLSNGFKLRGNYLGINGGGTYMYAAFAEFPFKYSRAR